MKTCHRSRSDTWQAASLAELTSWMSSPWRSTRILSLFRCKNQRRLRSSLSAEIPVLWTFLCQWKDNREFIRCRRKYSSVQGKSSSQFSTLGGRQKNSKTFRLVVLIFIPTSISRGAETKSSLSLRIMLSIDNRNIFSSQVAASILKTSWMHLANKDLLMESEKCALKIQLRWDSNRLKSWHKKTAKAKRMKHLCLKRKKSWWLEIC